MLSATLGAIEDFFLRPASSKRLARFRICFGVFALLEMLSLRPNWSALLGNEGVIEWVVSKELFATGGIPHILHIASLLKPLGISEDSTVLIVVNAYLLALLALTFGFRTRAAAGLAWILHVTIWNSGPTYGYGVESFTRVCLFYCIFIPVSEWWSLDARRRGKGGEDPGSWAAQLSRRVLQLHLCIIYLCSGIAKVQGEQWRSGEAMWRVLAQPEYAQFDMSWTAQFPLLLTVLSWSVLILEIGYVFLIWPKWTRPFALVGMLAMHAGIAVFMGLWGFGAVMIIMNVTAFWRYSDTRRLNLPGLIFRAPRKGSTQLGPQRDAPAGCVAPK